MAFDPRTEYQDQEVAALYEARRFGSLSGKLFQWAERRSLERVLARLPEGARILDAPCGTGRIVYQFLRHGLRVIGGDISAEMLAVARQRILEWNGRGSVLLSRMDLARIPLPDTSVIASFSIRFLPHIPPSERVQFLREFRRVTRQWVVISFSISTPWHRLRRRMKALLGHPKPVRYPVTNRALMDELRLAGLREIRRYRTFPILSEQVIVVAVPREGDSDMPYRKLSDRHARLVPDVASRCGRLCRSMWRFAIGTLLLTTAILTTSAAAQSRSAAIVRHRAAAIVHLRTAISIGDAVLTTLREPDAANRRAEILQLLGQMLDRVKFAATEMKNMRQLSRFSDPVLDFQIGQIDGTQGLIRSGLDQTAKVWLEYQLMLAENLATAVGVLRQVAELSP